MFDLFRNIPLPPSRRERKQSHHHGKLTRRRLHLQEKSNWQVALARARKRSKKDRRIQRNRKG